MKGEEFLIKAVAQRYANEPTVMAWNLINEPTVEWNPDTSLWTKWVHDKYSTETALRAAWSDYPKSGETWNGFAVPSWNMSVPGSARLYDYQLFREDIAVNWVSRMARAVRSVDNNHLITIEGIQYDAPVGGIGNPASYSAFNAHKLASLLDFINIHSYIWENLEGTGPAPDYGEFSTALLRYSYVNKPVVLGEFFYDDSVVAKTLGSVSGWSAYQCFGADPTLINPDGSLNPAGQKFKARAAIVKNMVLTRAADKSVYKLDMKTALTDVSNPANYLAYWNMAHASGPTGFSLTTGPTANALPVGFFDSASCSGFSGWACDADDYSQPLAVHFWVDGQAGQGGFFAGSTAANGKREAAVSAMCGGNANHGFYLALPDKLKDGKKHTIYAYAINIPSGDNPLLGMNAKVIQCAAAPSAVSIIPQVAGATTQADLLASIAQIQAQIASLQKQLAAIPAH